MEVECAVREEMKGERGTPTSWGGLCFGGRDSIADGTVWSAICTVDPPVNLNGGGVGGSRSLEPKAVSSLLRFPFGAPS